MGNIITFNLIITMKFIALIGAVAAVARKESPDCPTSQEVFSYNEKKPAAAGFVMTACNAYGVNGVSCIPNNQLFATGNNGDEDMGEDIIMKGEPFHYSQKLAQWNPVVVASTGPLPVCHGNNGPDGVNCAREACTGTNGPMDGPTGTPCNRAEPDSIPHYNT